MADPQDDRTSVLEDLKATGPATRWAAAFFAVGLLILLTPVFSKASYNGKFTAKGSDGSELCGLTLPAAFVTPSGDDDDRKQQKIDCAAKARSRVGWALLVLLLSLPPALLSLQPAKDRGGG